MIVIDPKPEGQPAGNTPNGPEEMHAAAIKRRNVVIGVLAVACIGFAGAAFWVTIDATRERAASAERIAKLRERNNQLEASNDSVTKEIQRRDSSARERQENPPRVIEQPLPELVVKPSPERIDPQPGKDTSIQIISVASLHRLSTTGMPIGKVYAVDAVLPASSTGEKALCEYLGYAGYCPTGRPLVYIELDLSQEKRRAFYDAGGRQVCVMVAMQDQKVTVSDFYLGACK